MFHALYTAASGMTAQQINLDNIANNLANASTSGFQARRVQFSDLLYQNEALDRATPRSFRPRATLAAPEIRWILPSKAPASSRF
jgi:flagellar basal body rod protein FlgG